MLAGSFETSVGMQELICQRLKEGLGSRKQKASSFIRRSRSSDLSSILVARPLMKCSYALSEHVSGFYKAASAKSREREVLTIHVKHSLTANLAQQGVFPQSVVVKRFGERSISSDELEQSSILGAAFVRTSYEDID
jgi:hypothetical protein